MSIAKTSRIRRVQWIATGFLTVGGIVNYLDRSALSIANQPISHELGLSPVEMGLLLSAFSWFYSFSQLPIGVLLDRLGARVMLGAGMLLWSAAQLTAGFVHSFSAFVTCRALLGLGEAPQFPAGAKVVSEWFNIRERGLPIGIFVGSSCLGPCIAPPLLTVLMLGFGWRAMFMIMGLLGIIVAASWYITYRNRSEVPLSPEERGHLADGEASEKKAHTPSFTEWRRLFAHRTTWSMIFGFMGVIYMVWLYLTWLPGYLEHERHLSIARTGWVVSIPYIFGALGMLSAGLAADRLLARGLSPIASRKWPVCIGLLGGAAFTLPAAYTPSLTMAIVYISAAMYFINMASAGAWTLVTVVTSSRQMASLGSIQNFGGYFGGSFAPIITGFVVERTGSFTDAFVISAAIAFIAALVYLFGVRSPVTEAGHGASDLHADGEVAA